VSGEALARETARHGHRSVCHVADREELCERLAAAARPGDVIVALGAGDINRILAPLEQRIQQRGPGGAGVGAAT
jgi:UDP-N-acetylmuramate--alanine ligase